MDLYVKEPGGYRLASTDEILKKSKVAIARKFRRGRKLMKPEHTKEYLATKFGGLEHEVFAAIWLDNRHQIIDYEELFRGTIDGASVHAREVVKRALQLNAAAVIFGHPHPSGVSEPSQADERITRKLQQALALIDVRVIDHIVVGETCVSFAERGLL